MLAANAEFQSRPGHAAAFGSDAHKLADPGHIEGDEWVVFEYPEPLVSPDKARGVVTRQTKDRLRQIVRPKAEEFRGLGDLASEQRGSRQLDHRADEVGHDHALSCHDL